MDVFSRDDLLTVVELSSICIGVFDDRKGRVHSLNKALKTEVQRTEFGVTVMSQTEDRIFGFLVEGGVPVSLRVLGGRSPAYLVEVYLAHTKDCSSRSDVIELIDLASDGVWEWFPSLNYEFMSKRFWGILGYNYREMPSSPEAWGSIIDPEDLEKATTCFKAHVATKGVTPYNMDVSYTHRKGHAVKVKCRGAVVEWLPDGTPWRMLGTHTDITEITEAVEAKVRFVSRISHEIRTPISAILHECELLDKYADTAVTEDACAQLLSLCNDILTVEKLSRPKALKLVTQSTSLKEFLHKAIRRNHGQAQKKRLVLSGKAHTPVTLRLMMDVGKCNQVVDNLISNAIKYTETGGSVMVELYCRTRGNIFDPSAPNDTHAGCGEQDDDAGDASLEEPFRSEEEWEVEIVVRDTGVGIYIEDQEVVFDRFMQANSSMQGAGLGLSISRELACFMAGDVFLRYSHPGKGSTFVFSFRASLAPKKSATQPSLTAATLAVGTSEAVGTARRVGSGAGRTGNYEGQPEAVGKAGTKREYRCGKSNSDIPVNGDKGSTGVPIIRILSADDMLTNRKIIRRRLLTIQEQLGPRSIEVVDAVDGRDAVRVFRDLGSFDVVFMDCLMPEMNGFDATRAIHRLCEERNIARVPVVAITASVSAALYRECMEAGMCQVVTKPFKTLDLLTVFAAMVSLDGKRGCSPPSPSPPLPPPPPPQPPPPPALDQLPVRHQSPTNRRSSRGRQVAS